MELNVLIFNKIRWDIIKYNEVIDHCRNINVYFVGTTKYSESLPKAWINQCKGFYIVDDINIEWLCSLVETIGKVDKIICFSEEDLYLAALIRDKYNIPGFSTKIIENFRDKFKMRNNIKNLSPNTRMPNYLLASDTELIFDEVKKTLKTEYIMLKPRLGMSSNGIRLIRDQEDFSKIVDEFLKYEANMWLLEEYISSKQFFHIDAFIQSDCIESMEYQYIKPNFDSIGNILGGILLPKDNKISQKLREDNINLIKSLLLKSGCTHTEYFLHKNELYLCEIAARIPGTNAVIASELASGNNYAQKWLCQELNITYPKKDIKYKFTGYIDFSASKSGKVTNILNISENHSWLIEKQRLCNLNSYLTPKKNCFERYLSYIITANSFEELQSRMKYASSLNPLRIE